MNLNIPPQLIQMLKCQNPQQMAMSMLQQNATNPIISNVMNMINSNNGQGVEQIARNLCKSKGIDPDELYNQILNTPMK